MSQLYENIRGIFLLFILLLTLYVTFIPKEHFNTREKDCELIIARYEEDLSWILEIPKELYTHIVIYNKGTPFVSPIPNVTIKDLPNLGRESHTYLTYIVDNYEYLPKLCIFLPGSVWASEEKKERVKRVIEFLKGRRESVTVGNKSSEQMQKEREFTLSEYGSTNSQNRGKNSETKLKEATIRPFGAWFDAHFPGEAMSCITYKGIVAVQRENIWKRPREWYVSLLEEHNHENPEVGHYSERSWASILSVPAENCLPY